MTEHQPRSVPSVPLGAVALVDCGVTHDRQNRPDLAIADFTIVLNMPDVPAEKKAMGLFSRCGTVLYCCSMIFIIDGEFNSVCFIPDARRGSICLFL